jgi:hypothetical protein
LANLAKVAKVAKVAKIMGLGEITIFLVRL